MIFLISPYVAIISQGIARTEVPFKMLLQTKLSQQRRTKGLPLQQDWALEDFWNQMCFPPTCKCLQSTIKGYIQSLKHSKVLNKGPEPLTTQCLDEGP